MGMSSTPAARAAPPGAIGQRSRLGPLLAAAMLAGLAPAQAAPPPAVVIDRQFVHPPLRLDFIAPEAVLLFLTGGPSGRDDSADWRSGFVLLPPGPALSPVLVDEYGPQGRPAEILSAFTANADQDPRPELLVLVGWPIEHPALGTSATFYKVFAYDDRTQGNDQGGRRLVRLDQVMAALGEGLHGWREGKKVSFPLRSAGAIRQRLAALGYR